MATDVSLGTLVQGCLDTGVVASNQRPVEIGGEDDGGNVVRLRASTNGRIRCLISADAATAFAGVSIPFDGDTGSSGVFANVTPSFWSGSAWFWQRTPSVFKSVQATVSGNTAVWTPPVNKKFRLMRFYLSLTENVTLGAAGVLTVKFQDAAADIGISFDVWVPSVALATAGTEWQSNWIDLGNGVLSSVAANSLNINLSAALVTGNLRVIAAGTEE